MFTCATAFLILDENNVFTLLILIMLWLLLLLSSSLLPVYEFISRLFSTYKEILDDEVGRKRKEAVVIYFELVATFEWRNLKKLRNCNREYITVEVPRHLI
jgi:hypothetical protein